MKHCDVDDAVTLLFLTMKMMTLPLTTTAGDEERCV